MENLKERERIRSLIYEELGTTYNEVELFLLNAFPGRHHTYLREWINRLTKPCAMCYMDEERRKIWLAVLLKLNKVNLDNLPEIKGNAE